MTTRVSIVIQSHLSDTLMEINLDTDLNDMATMRLKFVKYLVQRFGSNLEQYVDIDKVYEQYKEETDSEALIEYVKPDLSLDELIKF